MVKFTLRLTMTIVMVLFYYSTVSYAESITIAAENDWIPYAQKDGTGLSNEIIKAAFNSVDIQVNYKVLPYARVLYLIERTRNNQYVAGFNVPLDKKSKEKFIFGKKKLYDAISAYYCAINKPLKAKNRTQLKHGKKIAIVLGYGYGNDYLNRVKQRLITEEISNSDTVNLKKLSAGRVDATILYEKTANILLKKLKLESKIQFAFVNETIPIYLAFSKAYPNSQYYADKFDEGMIKIQSNGVYQNIIESY